MVKVRHAKSKREVELEALVQQAYSQLKRLKDNKKGTRRKRYFNRKLWL